MDTLVRIFNPKYYKDTKDMKKQLGLFFEDSSIVCANRKGSPSLQVQHNICSFETSDFPPTEE